MRKDKIYAEENIDHQNYGYYAMLSSRCTLIAVVLLIIIKLYGFIQSDSATMLSSFVDSVGDLVISLMSYYSLRIALRPADEHHRFGHGKAEGFSALFQGAFLIGAAVFLFFETLGRVFTPSSISHHGLGIIISLISIAMTLFVVMVQHYALKHANSLAVEADQKHYSSDIFLNLAVIIALLIDLWGGSPMVDQGITFGICAYMIWTGSHIGIKATDMLMDKEINQDQRQEILNIIDSHPEILGVHDLRTRQSGMHIYISFDIELDPDLTLKAAHDIARDVELNLLEKFPNADIMIHKDPKGDIYDTRHKVQGVHH